MDLPSHFAFGLAIGFVFFGRPEIALLIGLGALLPDLDREYWFIPQNSYADEQIHRAGLHNVFFMAITFLVSPYISIGVFLHVLQDSFTTVKDRGVEWFYPLTRFVKRGRYDSQGQEQPADPKIRVYLYQEDPPGLAKLADRDLQETKRSVPWRRVYGFAQNSHMLDRGFLYCSSALVIVWLFVPLDFSHVISVVKYVQGNLTFLLLAYGSVVILFLAGELDRRDRKPVIPRYNFMKFPIFFLGIIVLGIWIYLFSSNIESNLGIIFSDPVFTIIGGAIVLIVAIGTITWHRARGKPAVV